MADILYTYQNQVYANITNQCNCNCTFCIRALHQGVGSADTLWHPSPPGKEAVLDAVQNFDFTGYRELVFCGYGEPTCALDTLLPAAKYAKEQKGLWIRLNTNGLGSAQNGRDIVPELKEWIDTVSISLNAPDAHRYEQVTRPRIPDAFQEMRQFTRRCVEEGLDVQWTVVDVLPPEEIVRCEKLAKEARIPLRVRQYG